MNLRVDLHGILRDLRKTFEKAQDAGLVDTAAQIAIAIAHLEASVVGTREEIDEAG